MEPVDKTMTQSFNQGPQKRDLTKSFSELSNEFKRECVNGNITLHYSQGVVAKIHATKVY